MKQAKKCTRSYDESFKSEVGPIIDEDCAMDVHGDQGDSECMFCNGFILKMHKVSHE